jgi:hypothetical protein
MLNVSRIVEHWRHGFGNHKIDDGGEDALTKQVISWTFPIEPISIMN